MAEIFARTFDNGLDLKINDCSRKVAADRWLVKIAVVISCVPGGLHLYREQFSWADSSCWRELGNGPLMELARERNFIDRKDVDEIRDGIVNGLRTDIVNYLADPSFTVKLVSRRLEEIAKKFSRQPALPPGSDEDDGPADFSYLFK